MKWLCWPVYHKVLTGIIHLIILNEQKNDATLYLGLMYQHKKITKEEMEEARAIDVTSTLLPEDNRQVNKTTKYPAFIDLVCA